MAASLKKRGYRNLTIYDKSGRVGLHHRGAAQPQGTVFLEPSYWDTVVPLAEEYGLADLVRLPELGVWRRNSAFAPRSKISGFDFAVGDDRAEFLRDVVRYVRLHMSLFGG